MRRCVALALLMGRPALAACPGTGDGLAELSAASVAAHQALDVDAFRRYARELEATADCAVEPADGRLARDLYRISALLAWSSRDERHTREALRALVRTDPAFDLDLASAPQGSGLRDVLISVRAEPAREDVPLGDGVTVGGAPSSSVPAGELVWLQRAGEDGLVSWYGSSTRAPGAFRPPDPRRRASRALAVTGGASLALGLASLGIAQERKQYFLHHAIYSMSPPSPNSH